jgi:hypothetical protein
MNLLEMLEAANRPWTLPNTQGPRDKPPKPEAVPSPPRKAKTPAQIKASENANAKKQEQAYSLYKEHAHGTWVGTRVLEVRMGRGRSSVLDVLRKWEALGHVESRYVDEVNYNRNKGLEWRFLK